MNAGRVPQVTGSPVSQKVSMEKPQTTAQADCKTFESLLQIKNKWLHFIGQE